MIYYLICSFFFSLDACDLGGPRRHFFTLLLREIYEKMTKDGKFLYNDQFQRNSYYHAAGVFIGKHLVDLPFSHNGTIVIILASHRWMTYNLIDTQSPDWYSIMNHMIIITCMLLPSYNLLGILGTTSSDQIFWFLVSLYLAKPILSSYFHCNHYSTKLIFWADDIIKQEELRVIWCCIWKCCNSYSFGLRENRLITPFNLKNDWETRKMYSTLNPQRIDNWFWRAKWGEESEQFIIY